MVKDWLNRLWTNRGLLAPKLRLFSLANFRKYLQFCRLYGWENATKLAFRRVPRPRVFLDTEL